MTWGGMSWGNRLTATGLFCDCAADVESGNLSAMMEEEVKPSLPGNAREQFLAWEEWWFDEVPTSELTVCFFWEYCREFPALLIGPKTIQGFPRVLDLKKIFLQGPGIHGRLTQANGPVVPWQRLQKLLRAKIALGYNRFFQAVEKVPEEDSALPPPEDGNFRKVTLLIDWGYSDAAKREGASPNTVHPFIRSVHVAAEHQPGRSRSGPDGISQVDVPVVHAADLGRCREASRRRCVG